MKEEKIIKLLRLMMKNSRLSDRELARTLGTSQPTVTRMRQRLEKEGYIRSYTIVPDFVKMGYGILAFTFSKVKTYPSAEEARGIIKKAAEWANKRHNVIFSADGQGLGGKDIVMVSFHKDYDDYTQFMHSFAFDWGHLVDVFETFIVSLKSELTMKPFDLKYLGYQEEMPS